MTWFITNEDIYAKLAVMHQLMLNHFGIIEQKETTLMTAVTDLATSVAAEDTVIASAIALIKGLSAALAAAGTDPEALAALKTDIDNQTAAMAAAVLSGTPAPPATPGPTVVPAAAMAEAKAAT